MDYSILSEHFSVLSLAYTLSVDDHWRWLVVEDFNLPWGYNHSQIQVLIELPNDYPLSPPGVGSSGIFLPRSIRYHDRELRDLHPRTRPRVRCRGKWAWFCYQWIHWDPMWDDLVKLLEMVRADLTNPKTY